MILVVFDLYGPYVDFFHCSQNNVNLVKTAFSFTIMSNHKSSVRPVNAYCNHHFLNQKDYLKIYFRWAEETGSQFLRRLLEPP